MALSSYFAIPVLRPTAEEMGDFSSFVEKHIAEFREVGLIKIVPPSNWATNLPTEKDADSFEVSRPIKQEVKGRQGLWETTNVEQKSTSVPEFRKLAEKQDIESADKSYAERERIFWKNMGRFPATYGADNQGSLFEKTGCSWNFNKIKSVLSYLDRDLPGINKAYLYFGMWKALFAWHSEDLELFSINYVHFGAPKEWYCIRPKDRARFESVANSLFPGHARACQQFLRHKLSLISPSILRSYGFEVGHIVQEPGEFIVTFPAAFHMGFNHGWNCAESVNFALPCWFEFGKRARVCRCHPDSVRFDVLSLERRWMEATGSGPKLEETSNEVWQFTCRCREDWRGSDTDPERPVGHLFLCVCKTWSHVDCYPRYADKDPIALPLQMYCHKCRPVKTKRLSTAVDKSAAAEPKAHQQREKKSKSPEKSSTEDSTTSPVSHSGSASTSASSIGSISTITPAPPLLPLAIAEAAEQKPIIAVLCHAPLPPVELASPLLPMLPGPFILATPPQPAHAQPSALISPLLLSYATPTFAPPSFGLSLAAFQSVSVLEPRLHASTHQGISIGSDVGYSALPPPSHQQFKVMAQPEMMQVSISAPEGLPNRSLWPVDTSVAQHQSPLQGYRTLSMVSPFPPSL